MSSKYRVAVVAFSFVAGVAGLLHCGGGDDSASPGGSTDAGGGGDTAVIGDGGGGGEAGSTVVDVNGTTKTQGSRFVPSRVVANVPLTVIGADGTSSSTTSGADGTFHVSGVATPYDVWLPPSADGGGVGSNTYYAGLTRSDPQLVAYDSQPNPPSRSATLTFTTTACSGCTVYVTATPFNGSFEGTGTGAAAPYSGQIHWTGDATTTANIYVVVFQAGNIVKHLVVEGQTLSDTGTLALGTVSLNALAGTQNVIVNASYPAGLTLDNDDVTFYASDGDEVGYASGATATSTIQIPQEDWRIDFSALAVTQDGNNSVFCTASYPGFGVVPAAVSFALPELIAPIAPQDKAIDVPLTQKLVWSPVPGNSVYGVYLSGATSGLTVRVAGNEFDLSKLVKAGVVFKSGDLMTWFVATAESATSMDDLTQPGGSAAPGVGEPRCFTSTTELHFAFK